MSKDNQATRGMSIIKMIASLGSITIGAAVILAIVYNATKAPIAASRSAAQVAAVEAVVPPFDNNPVAEAVTVTPEGATRPLVIYPARMDGKLVGAAVETYSDNGFSGLITLMVGFDIEGTVIDYRILSHAETPGLGAKMGEWFRDSIAHRSILHLNPASTSFFVVKDPAGQIDGITAATISSRAFLEAVRRAHDTFMSYRDSTENRINL